MADLEAAWQKQPDLRFGQIIATVYPEGTDIFNTEDDVFAEALRTFRTKQDETHGSPTSPEEPLNQQVGDA
jgi:hypothetical protein